MKRFLSILLAVLVIAACASSEANAKKRKTSNRKATTTTIINKGDLDGFWVENLLHGLQLQLNYDWDDDTYSATLYGMEELCSGSGEVRNNTLYLDCSEGYTLTCTLKGGKLIVRVKSPYFSGTSKMERN